MENLHQFLFGVLSLRVCSTKILRDRINSKATKAHLFHQGKKTQKSFHAGQLQPDDSRNTKRKKGVVRYTLQL
jgi:hypothetical protein